MNAGRTTPAVAGTELLHREDAESRIDRGARRLFVDDSSTIQ
jgi:hypothetical protein